MSSKCLANTVNKKLKLSIFSILLFALFIQSASAIEKPENELGRVGIDSKLGGKVDLDLTFTTENGERKPLREIIDSKRPILLTPVYYTCPRLCGLLLGGATKLFNELNLKLGSEYQIVTVSFNENESAELARTKAQEYRKKLTKSDIDPQSWHFLVGDKQNIAALMSQIGFRYFKDKDEYAHTAAIIILTPQGEISQYFTGIDFSPWDVRLALIEASQGKVGSLIDHILLYCFRYDHSQGKYTWAVFKLLRIGGLLSILGLSLVVYWAARGRRVRS